MCWKAVLLMIIYRAFLVTFPRSFDSILWQNPSCSHIPESSRIVQIRMTFKWRQALKGSGPFADLNLSRQSGTIRKKIVCTKKVHKIDLTEVSFITNYNRAGEFLFMFHKIKQLCSRKSRSACQFNYCCFGPTSDIHTSIYNKLLWKKSLQSNPFTQYWRLS